MVPETGQISAMVLAAGLGTRLLPLTRLRAKPAIPLLGRPLIHYSMDLIAGLNPAAVVVNVHHLPETVISAVHQYTGPGVHGQEEPQVLFSEEVTVQGTAGGVRQAARWLETDQIVVINGKIYSDLEMSGVVRFHRREEALVTLVVVPFEPGCPFNPVRLDQDGRVLGFGPEGPGRPHVFTGIQILQHEVVAEISTAQSDLVKDVYPPLIAQGKRILAYVSSSLWYECSTPWRYLQASVQLHRKRSAGLVLHSGQPAESCLLAGSGSSIGAGSTLRDSILWEGAEIGKNCFLSNAIICSEVRIPDHSQLSEVIVTPRMDTEYISSVARPVEEKGCLVWPLRPE